MDFLRQFFLMLASLFLILICAGCSNISDTKVKAEIGFGEFIGQWLPRISVELEFKNDVRSEQ